MHQSLSMLTTLSIVLSSTLESRRAAAATSTSLRFASVTSRDRASNRVTLPSALKIGDTDRSHHFAVPMAVGP